MSQITEPTPDSEYERHAFDGKASQESTVIPIIEEQIHIEKQVVESGIVRVSKKVHEEQVTVEVPLIHEEHDVERVEINQYVDQAPSIRHDGATMIIPVLREEVVVQKRLLLVEELRITKKLVQTKKQEEVTLRREEVIVERDTIDKPSVSPDL